MDLKSFIIEKAKQLNIDKIGFTDGSPLLNIEDYLTYRIENNLQTEFEEIEIQRRIEDRKSVV